MLKVGKIYKSKKKIFGWSGSFEGFSKITHSPFDISENTLFLVINFKKNITHNDCLYYCYDFLLITTNKIVCLFINQEFSKDDFDFCKYNCQEIQSVNK